jgi:hypothetical protein
MRAHTRFTPPPSGTIYDRNGDVCGLECDVDVRATPKAVRGKRLDCAITHRCKHCFMHRQRSDLCWRDDACGIGVSSS